MAGFFFVMCMWITSPSLASKTHAGPTQSDSLLAPPVIYSSTTQRESLAFKHCSWLPRRHDLLTFHSVSSPQPLHLLIPRGLSSASSQV